VPGLSSPRRNDVAILFATRAVRLFAYGFLSVVLVLYLAALGFSETKIGTLLTLTLVGDTILSLGITTRADRAGRRRMLLAGAALMAAAGALFAATSDFWILLLAATVGVISPAGNEVGPFLAIEQAALAQRIPAERRTRTFAWYSLTGSFATALGALSAGGLAGALQRGGLTEVASYRAVVAGYAALGLVLATLFSRLSPAIEAASGDGVVGAPGSISPSPVPSAPLRQAHSERGAEASRLGSGLGLGRSRGIVLRLSALFGLDAFAGGFVVQSFVAWWFHERFGAPVELLGAIFFGANVLAGVSALSAGWLAARIGLVNTMVFTHLPSNLLLLLVPLMPNLPLAIAVLLARFSISQMDVPTRQSYVMAVVEPGERAAAAGVTGIARTVGAAIAPLAAGPLYASAALSGVPFVAAGGLKIVYDLLLWRGFRAARPPEESALAPVRAPDRREPDRPDGGAGHAR
jgi:MFS family permease